MFVIDTLRQGVVWCSARPGSELPDPRSPPSDSRSGCTALPASGVTLLPAPIVRARPPPGPAPSLAGPVLGLLWPPPRFWHHCKQTTTDPTTFPCFSAYFILMVAVLTILSYCFAARSHTHHQLLPRQVLVHPFKAGTAWSLIRYIHLAAPAPPTMSRHTHILVLLYLYL